MNKKRVNHHSFFIVNNNKDYSVEVSARIKKLLLRNGWTYNKAQHEYLIVVGGDGTYVRCLRKYYEKFTKIVCVNTGTVGFYAKFNANNLINFVNIITNENNFIHPQLLQIHINGKHTYNAMNEFVVQSLNTIRMDVKINNNLYENFIGTGILISTKTGATGQAKSNGGAIIFPNASVIELVEISPTNHSMHHSFNAPVILHDSSTIELHNFKSAQRCDLIIDGMRVKQVKEGDRIIITKQDAPFSLCFNQNVDGYIKKLQQTFIKG